jgi:adenine C2-methylase RlmN of 23S rRNA A2503 and tRNA A37
MLIQAVKSVRQIGATPHRARDNVVFAGLGDASTIIQVSLR